MTTLTFKLEEKEARSLRVAARRAKLTLSEYLRQRLRDPAASTAPVGRMKCPQTGVEIFAPAPQFPRLTTESVREMLGEFP